MKITKSQLKQIIKEELSRALRENEGMPMPAEEEVTHEEVIEKVQELPQGALAQIWELLKTIEQGGTKFQKWINTTSPEFRAHQTKHGIGDDPHVSLPESKKKKTKK